MLKCDMDFIFAKIILVLNAGLFVTGSPIAMLQHATSSQSIVFHPIQAPATTPVPSNTISLPTVDEFSKGQAKYEFKYEVADAQTGDRKSHWESRDGDTVRGAYTLYEPDGSLRTVEYTADTIHGFNAVIKRSMPSKHKPSLLSASNEHAIFPGRLSPDHVAHAEVEVVSGPEHGISKGYLKPKVGYLPGVNFSVDHVVPKSGVTPNFAY